MPKKTHYDAADQQAVVTFATNHGVSFNQDASVFLARELDYVKRKVYEKKFPEMMGLVLVPISTETPEWAETVVTKSYDAVGMAKIISNYADDLPRADVEANETTVRVKTIGDSYGYNVNELRASQALGAELPTRKANAARRAVEIKQNRIALLGDAEHGLYGLMNHPNIGTTSGLTGNWAASGTTALQIVEDIDTLIQAVQLQSLGTHKVNRVALPSIAMAAAQRKYVAETGGKSALAIAKENHPGVEFLSVAEFNDLTGASVTSAIAGEFSVDNASFELVMPFNQLPAQARNLELVTPCLARTAGVSVYYPLAFTKATGL